MGMKTVHNFYAGPCVLPGQAVEAAIEALKDFSGTGLSDDRHKFALLHLGRDAVQGVDWRFGVVAKLQIIRC